MSATMTLDEAKKRHDWLRGLGAGSLVAVEEFGRIVWRGVVVRVTPTGIIKVRHENDSDAPGNLKAFNPRSGKFRDPVYYFRRIVPVETKR